jgi:subtilisin family serine protease
MSTMLPQTSLQTSCLAGIIGARNNGAGVFGVVPGMPIVAMKVLGAGGSGSLDIVYKAYAEVLARLQRGERIAAINLSLGAAVGDQNAINTECSWVSRIAAYGTAVVVAAGEFLESCLVQDMIMHM